jgi:hypothetical protein
MRSSRRSNSTPAKRLEAASAHDNAAATSPARRRSGRAIPDILAPAAAGRLRDNPDPQTGGTTDATRAAAPHNDPDPFPYKEDAVSKTLIAGLTLALTSASGMSAAVAAGTTNGNAGCVAQINTVEGTPGQNIETIKLYVSPIPGDLISTVARSDRTSCELPR